MRPLIMQLAAGITPLNESGTPVATEIIPIIIDPHRSNEDLKRTENLLNGTDRYATACMVTDRM